MPATYRQWFFTRPLDDGQLTPSHFALRELPMPEPAEGEALVRVKLINVHSATRLRMAGGATPLGGTDRTNYACAEVVRSRDPAFREGDVIACQAGWQDWQIVSSADRSVGYGDPGPAVKALNRTNSQWTYVFRPELAVLWPPEVLMDVFGTSGTTAWFGLRDLGPVTAQDVVAVGGTTGSVGALAAQLARHARARVIGFAGSAAGRRWVLDELGIDHCLDYRAPDLGEQIAAIAPEGVSVFLDGIGGGFTETLVGAMRQGGRMLSYGSAGDYYGGAVSAPLGRDMRATFGISPRVQAMIDEKRIRSEAWIVDAFYAERLAAEDDLSRLLQAGALKPVNTVVRGFERLPEAIVDLYRTPHRGKLQIDFR